MRFSFIIPVFNRPEETDELLESLLQQSDKAFQVVIIEDGSTIDSEKVVAKYQSKLDILYIKKTNTGPGDSRNFGMQQAVGDYFIILDSDCILPPNYFAIVKKKLQTHFVDCFGGVDSATDSFSDIQKAINYSMTSFFTTGGIRGGSEKIAKFQPRSFNMGLSKKAFEASNGFANIHPGEDPDLSIRLWKMGFETQLFSDAKVFHKRRIDWQKFFTQVLKFGKVRPILDNWHPEFSKLIFWFPTLFIFFLFISILLAFFSFFIGIAPFLIYFLLLFIHSTFINKSIKIGLLSVLATFIQFIGYGYGFAVSFFWIKIAKKKPESIFPNLFFIKK